MVTALASARDINKYLDALKARKKSKTTIRTARSVLHLFAAITRVPILEATPDDVERWQRSRAATVGTAALRTQGSYVKGYYRWAVRHGLREDDPTTLMDLPRAPRRRPRPIREALLRQAIDEADPVMRAILCLAAMAGLRACEIASLDWSEVWLGDSPEMRVVGKGGHTDMVPCSPQLVEVLQAVRRRVRRGPVIPRADGAPGHNTPVRISQMANRYLRSLDIDEYTLHSLRHRFVTKAYLHGRDLRAAQEAARHASPTTTAGYTAVGGEAVRGAVNAAGDVGDDDAS
jgi:integrase